MIFDTWYLIFEEDRREKRFFMACGHKKRRATTNRSPNPNLKNYQNEKINLNVNRFSSLYGNNDKSNP